MSGYRINQVTLSGSLVADPDLRTVGTGMSRCRMRIAHNDRFKQGSQWTTKTMYFDIQVWRGMGEWCATNLHKGDQIVVAGRLRWSEWEADGHKRQAVDVVADSIVPTYTLAKPKEQEAATVATADEPPPF